MKIFLDYNQNKKSKLTEGELTYDYLTHAVNVRFDKGLTGSKRRIWGRLQRKLDAALKVDSLDKSEVPREARAAQQDQEIEIEAAERDFLVDVFRDETKVLFPAELSKYVMVLEDEIATL